jgi:hypothetical protein
VAAPRIDMAHPKANAPDQRRRDLERLSENLRTPEPRLVRGGKRAGFDWRDKAPRWVFVVTIAAGGLLLSVVGSVAGSYRGLATAADVRRINALERADQRLETELAAANERQVATDRVAEREAAANKEFRAAVLRALEGIDRRLERMEDKR